MRAHGEMEEQAKTGRVVACRPRPSSPARGEGQAWILRTQHGVRRTKLRCRVICRTKSSMSPS